MFIPVLAFRRNLEARTVAWQTPGLSAESFEWAPASNCWKHDGTWTHNLFNVTEAHRGGRGEGSVWEVEKGFNVYIKQQNPKTRSGAVSQREFCVWHGRCGDRVHLILMDALALWPPNPAPHTSHHRSHHHHHHSYCKQPIADRDHPTWLQGTGNITTHTNRKCS